MRDAFFAARRFEDLVDLNQQAAAWTASAALDHSWVEDRSRTVRQAFDEEKPLLLPLGAEPFPAYERADVEVGKTPYVRFDLNDYSVPHDSVGRTLRCSRLRSTHGLELSQQRLRPGETSQRCGPGMVLELNRESSVTAHGRGARPSRPRPMTARRAP